MTQCHICGKEIEEPKYISVVLHDKGRKKGVEWRMDMHQGECYYKFISTSFQLINEDDHK